MNRAIGRGGRGQGVHESRPYDYLYDPNYTICSQKDFYKEVATGARSSARLKLRPVFPTMFSERRQDRRIEPCLVMPKPNILGNFMPQHDVMGVPVMPMQDDCVHRREIEPTGADRALFVDSYYPPSYVTTRPKIHLDMDDGTRKNKRHRKGFLINRAVQTDYRESETQTDPYTPPYTLPYPGAYPKVLALLKMTWGKGLPATLEDIVIIERALMRRMLDVGVHDNENSDEFERRVKLMEELEAQQWADRERELSVIMECKMRLVQKALNDLKNKSFNVLTNKMEKMFEANKQVAGYKLAKLRHEYLRAVRRIERSTFGEKGNGLKRNVVKQYVEADSHVCPPVCKRKDPNADPMCIAPKYFRDRYDMDDLNNLVEDPDFVKNQLLFDRERFAKRMGNAKASPKHKRLEATLTSVFEAFRSEINKKAKEDESEFMRQVITSTIHRMQTPTVEGNDLDDERKELCIVNLQKVIRGRVVQTLMREEMNHNMDSILHLKALHKADPYGLNTTYGQACAQAELQADRELQQEKQNEVTEIVDQLEGETLGRMFDFLEKEMVRLLDERKIHALMILAERERRMKEATEGGRRQKEEEERRINDEIFRQVVGIHQSTVDMYLEDMFLEAINCSADANAREYVQGLARTINEAAYIGDQGDEGLDKEEVAADLVYSFILPELNRLHHRERLDHAASRYTAAARHVTDATIGAQGFLKETLDALLPTVAEHVERAEAAVDATQIMVDAIIKGAVESVMEDVYELTEKREEPKSDQLTKSKEDELEAEISSETELQHGTISDEELGEYEYEADEDEDTGREPPKDPYEQYLDDVDEALDSMPPAYIPVGPEFKDELAQMSVQVTHGTELEETTVALYRDETEEVVRIFDAVHKMVEPKKPSAGGEEEMDENDDQKDFA